MQKFLKRSRRTCCIALVCARELRALVPPLRALPPLHAPLELHWALRPHRRRSCC